MMCCRVISGLFFFLLPVIAVQAQPDLFPVSTPYTVAVPDDSAANGMWVEAGPIRSYELKAEKWLDKMNEVLQKYMPAGQSYQLDLEYIYQVSPKGKVRSVEISEAAQQISSEDLKHLHRYAKKIRFYPIDDWKETQRVVVRSSLGIDFGE